MARAFVHPLGIAALAASVAFGSGCAQAVRVAVDRRPDFSASRTWSWLPPSGEVPPEIDALVRGAIAGELVERGFERAREGEPADFLVGYDLELRREFVMKTETGAQQRLESFGSSGGFGGTPGAFEITGSERRLVAYDEGSLRLDLAQGASPHLVWRAFWVGRARGGIAGHVDEAVSELFERFPASVPAP